MTFGDLKSEILGRLKRREICPAYQEALLATTNAELIASVAAEFYLWVYQTGIVDDTLLEEFTDEELNAAGIYKAGVTLENPANDIYLINAGESTITIDGTNKLNLFVAGVAEVNLTLNDTSLVELKTYTNAVVNATLNNDSILRATASHKSQLTIIQNDSAVSQELITDESQLDYTGNDSSYALLKAYNYSSITYQLNDPAAADIKRFNNATINTTPL